MSTLRNHLDTLAQTGTSRAPGIQIQTEGKPPLVLRVPPDFWTIQTQHHNHIHEDVHVTPAFLKFWFCKAVNAMIATNQSNTTALNIVDNFGLSDDDYCNHVMALMSSDDEQSDHDPADLCLEDLTEAVNKIVSFTDESLNGIKEKLNSLAASLSSVDSIQATLNEFRAEMQPVLSLTDDSRRKRNMAPLSFHNYHSGLGVILEDVLERLQKFNSKFSNPGLTYNFHCSGHESLIRMTNFAANLLKIPSDEHMPETDTNMLIRAGMANTTVQQDFERFMRVHSRIKMEDLVVSHKVNNGPPEYLEFKHDAFYIVKVHYSCKTSGDAAFTYFGYLPIVRTIIYCSLWDEHPFTEGHPSRYTDENGDKIAVHYWQISDSNRNKLSSYDKTVIWRIFMNEKAKDAVLQHVSIGIIDPAVAEGDKRPPKKLDSSSVPPSPADGTGPTADTVSSPAAELGLGGRSLRNRDKSSTKKVRKRGRSRSSSRLKKKST